MRGPWRIGRIMGIDISLDWSWFIILALLVYGLGFNEFPRELHPRTFFPRVDVISIALAILTSLLLFASVLAHELSHSWMAIQRGIPVTKITLFIFGGVAQIADEPDRPGTEFLIAIMGPLMSVALAALFGAAWLWLRILDGVAGSQLPLLPLVLLTGLLAQSNGALALFNMAPGFPLDGGRVFRAILWAVFHDVRRATLWATRAGQAIAILLLAFGAWQFLTEFNGSGIWYALIGVFLWNAAGQGYDQTVLREMLRGVRVDQLMTRTVQSVPPEVSIEEFVVRYVIPLREQTFAVSDGSALLGIITTNHLQDVPRPQWHARRVRDVMTPRTSVEPLEPGQTAAAALGRLSRADADELPVVDGDHVIGFFGRGQLARFLRLKINLRED